jgi:hypothetical protein
MDPIYNGTSEHLLNLIKELYPILSKNYLVSILVNPESDFVFGVSKIYENVIISNTL